MIQFIHSSVRFRNDLSVSAAVAWLSGTFVSAATFKQYVVSPSAKLTFFSVTSVAMAACSLYITSVKTYWLLVVLLMARSFIAAAWETAGAGLLVHTMGPVRQCKSYCEIFEP